jgi:hypothetical protein
MEIKEARLGVCHAGQAAVMGSSALLASSCGAPPSRARPLPGRQAQRQSSLDSPKPFARHHTARARSVELTRIAQPSSPLGTLGSPPHFPSPPQTRSPDLLRPMSRPMYGPAAPRTAPAGLRRELFDDPWSTDPAQTLSSAELASLTRTLKTTARYPGGSMSTRASTAGASKGGAWIPAASSPLSRRIKTAPPPPAQVEPPRQFITDVYTESFERDLIASVFTIPWKLVDGSLYEPTHEALQECGLLPAPSAAEDVIAGFEGIRLGRRSIRKTGLSAMAVGRMGSKKHNTTVFHSAYFKPTAPTAPASALPAQVEAQAAAAMPRAAREHPGGGASAVGNMADASGEGSAEGEAHRADTSPPMPAADAGGWGRRTLPSVSHVNRPPPLSVSSPSPRSEPGRRARFSLYGDHDLELRSLRGGIASAQSKRGNSRTRAAGSRKMFARKLDEAAPPSVQFNETVAGPQVCTLNPNPNSRYNSTRR